MILDIHTHLWLGRVEECRKAILVSFERYGYIRAWVSTLRSYIPDEDEIRECNSATLSFMRDYPDMIRGWCYLNPANSDVMDVLRRNIEDNGMGGVKLWVATLCDDERVNSIAEYCIDSSIPVLIHTLDKTVGQLPYESRGMNVRTLALRYPELRIIMAHLGGNEYTGIKPIIDCKNVMTDICGVMYRADSLEYAVEKLGVDRIMYGTDSLSNIPFWHLIGRVNSLRLSDEEKERIFCRNAIEYGL